jgi:hypothetical protein
LDSSTVASAIKKAVQGLRPRTAFDLRWCRPRLITPGRRLGRIVLLFSHGPFVEALFFEDLGEVIDVQAIAHARTRYGCADRCNAAVAVVVASHGVVQHANSYDFAPVESKADNLVAVLRFASVSVVHGGVPQLVI